MQISSVSGHATDRARPPGPPGLPIVGNALAMARDVLGYFTNCQRHYGDFVALRVGRWPVLLLSAPDAIEKVLVKEHYAFAKPLLFWRQVSAIFGQGLLTSEGEAWARQRRLMAPAFAGRRLDAYGATMVRLTHAMLEQPAWRTGAALDVHAAMMGLTLGIAAKTLFDCEVERDVSAVDHAVNVLADEIASRVSRPILIPDRVPLPGHVRYNRALREIEGVVHRLIEERRSHPKDCDQGDLLSALVAARDEAGRSMTARQLRDEVVTLLLAGHETTALALSWTWFLLGWHPAIQEELAAEVRAVVGARAVTVADLPRLPLVAEVIVEAMRLYPPAWAIGRAAVQDCEIGDYRIPAGTTVYISAWVIQRDARYFDQPKVFRPERWRDGLLAKRLPRFAYLPFGGGPRVCIGHRFAMMEASLVLATMVQRVRIAGRGSRAIVPTPSITLRPKGGVWVTAATRRA